MEVPDPDHEFYRWNSLKMRFFTEVSEVSGWVVLYVHLYVPATQRKYRSSPKGQMNSIDRFYRHSCSVASLGHLRGISSLVLTYHQCLTQKHSFFFSLNDATLLISVRQRGLLNNYNIIHCAVCTYHIFPSNVLYCSFLFF